MISIEEKAKPYDEAVRKAKGIIEYYKTHNRNDEASIKDLEIIFPELKESEDERIRKELICFLNTEIPQCDARDKYISWLEKQSEKKTIIIPKFRVGDEIKTKNEESLTITKIDEEGYWSEDLFICGFDEECEWDLVKEQKPMTQKKKILSFKDIEIGDTVYVYSKLEPVQRATVTYLDKFDVYDSYGLYSIGYGYFGSKPQSYQDSIQSRCRLNDTSSSFGCFAATVYFNREDVIKRLIKDIETLKRYKQDFIVNKDY